MYDTRRKEDRARKAAAWVDTLNTEYKVEIQHAIENTIAIHFTDETAENLSSAILSEREDTPYCPSPEVEVICTGVIEAAAMEAQRKAPDDRVCVLNFASYKNPGGGFMKGTLAQEEAICHSTGLYPILLAQEKWYGLHYRHLNSGAYSDDFIYTRDVPLFHDGKMWLVDVLTMAAVNQKIAKIDLRPIMEYRMRLAYKIPHRFGATVVTLGAWGCGVFGNNIRFVAETWKDYIEEYGLYRRIIHPIPDEKNYQLFKAVFK